MKNKKIFFGGVILLLLLSSCIKQNGTSYKKDYFVRYNLIKPSAGIYVITKKNVAENEIKNHSYEKKYFKKNKLIKIERYNTNGKLTDEFSVSAITKFEYDYDGHIKYVKYFDRLNKKATDKSFGYWSIEYIYDYKNRVVMEIYRNKKSKFLEVPRNMNGKIIKKNFLAPIFTYEYLDNNIRIKAFDKKFNLLKEVVGKKPCVPFIDCGENE